MYSFSWSFQPRKNLLPETRHVRKSPFFKFPFESLYSYPKKVPTMCRHGCATNSLRTLLGDCFCILNHKYFRCYKWKINHKIKNANSVPFFLFINNHL